MNHMMCLRQSDNVEKKKKCKGNYIHGEGSNKNEKTSVRKVRSVKYL